MKKYALPAVYVLFLCILTVPKVRSYIESQNTGAPPYEIEDLQPPDDPYAWIKEWKRPDGPRRVGLQVGHWKNDELPEELNRLIGSTGTQGGGYTEVAINLRIAEETKKRLEKEGIVVDILPATVPEKYYADVFVAIHADGSTDRTASGYKLATPRRDFSGKANRLSELITESYGKATNLALDPNVTQNMKGYYAFAWWRYNHAVHPMAPSLILETGFLTNTHDRKIIALQPEKSAEGLAQGIMTYFNEQK